MINFIKKSLLKRKTLNSLKTKGYKAVLSNSYLIMTNNQNVETMMLESYLETLFKTSGLDFEVYINKLVTAIDKVNGTNSQLDLKKIIPRLVSIYQHKKEPEDKIAIKYTEIFNLAFVEDIGPWIIDVYLRHLEHSSIKNPKELEKIAVENLSKYSDDIEVEEVYEGIWSIVFGEEGCATSLLLLPNLIKKLKIETKGEPILFALSADYLLVADSDNINALIEAASRAIEFVSGSEKYIFARPLRLIKEKWEIYDIDSNYSENFSDNNEMPNVKCAYFRALIYIDYSKRYNDFIDQKFAEGDSYCSSLSYITYNKWYRIYYSIFALNEIAVGSFIPKTDVVFITNQNNSSLENSDVIIGKIIPFSSIAKYFGSILTEVYPNIYQVTKNILFSDLEKINSIPFCAGINTDDLSRAFIEEVKLTRFSDSLYE